MSHPVSHDKHVNENMSNMLQNAKIQCHIAMSPLHACGRKMGHGTFFGLILKFLSQTLGLLSLHEWVRACGHRHFAKGQGLWSLTWVGEY